MSRTTVSDRAHPEVTSKTAIRVIRGGSWDNDAERCRSAYRRRIEPDDRLDYLGFRVPQFRPASQQESSERSRERKPVGREKAEPPAFG
jgi:hypothetical protein